MILFFRLPPSKLYVVGTPHPLEKTEIEKLVWLFGGPALLEEKTINGIFIGPRKEMITPWSTNAVEITQTMGISGIYRIEEFEITNDPARSYDRMLNVLYHSLDQDVYTNDQKPEPIIEVEDISSFNFQEGLALNEEEVEYLKLLSKQLNRNLTDSEVFGFSQVNSEHCRHKIFNGTFIIDGHEQESSLFQLIKKTSKEHPNFIVSAYKDNVAFIQGPTIEQFAPARHDVADFFSVTDIDSVISLKAETHNFPTTVEPFNGAATGSGGEIRDRLAGGKGSLPLAGTAVYMTSYPRLENDRPWEKNIDERKWLYQTPLEILLKASDGASDFGNKFGQPLICGSVFTFEYAEEDKTYGYDKVIMLAGGVGFGNAKDAQKGHLRKDDKIVLLGGDNYRIGLGGGAVSSVATGEFGNTIELNAIQRSNPEMQKRVMNAIRAMVESSENPIISIHDHGAGGHLNCLSELLEETGGTIQIDQLPVGDPTLSDKEIISNESQERMGLAIGKDNIELLKRVSERERAPFYLIGSATGNHQLIFTKKGQRKNPIELGVNHLFGSSPKTIIQDNIRTADYSKLKYDSNNIETYLNQVLQLESVACKDWLTNKVDRSVTGKVATQQTCGPIQLPLNNVGVMALDFLSSKGVATAIGHAPGAAMISPAAGSRLAVAEALTNLIWTPLTHGLKGISLSANWMWPCKNVGEDARLYEAVKAISDFTIQLGINIPTGKDSLSMTQKYPDGKAVVSPGTVIVSAVAESADIRKTVSPAIKPITGSKLLYIDFSGCPCELGGSAFSQILNQIGSSTPDVAVDQFKKSFNAIQSLIAQGRILAGHDIGSGGLITTLLEMCFSQPDIGLNLNFPFVENDLVKVLFHENPGVVIQINDESSLQELENVKVKFFELGFVTQQRKLNITFSDQFLELEIDKLRDVWFKTSFLMDSHQRPEQYAKLRFNNYKNQSLNFEFPKSFTGRFDQYNIDPYRRTPSGIRTAIIREKGVNGDREMAYSLYLAGMDVKDIHMTDLISGSEDLSDIQMIVFVGGFSNSDVLGSAKGWAGAFKYNTKAKAALDKFYKRSDTLSLGVCNGCQLMLELGLIYPDMPLHPKMKHNASGKFESAFINISIPETQSIMLQSLRGSRLGVWVAHGEGRFELPIPNSFQAAAFYSQTAYPGNPNGSDHAVAALSSFDGRHLAIMPHIERSLFSWNWPHYPEYKNHEISPWIEAFVNAREWLAKKNK